VLSALIATAGISLPQPSPAAAGPLPDFRDSVVLAGLTNPTAVEFSPDGRIFVAEKSGIIRVFAELGAPGTVFADLRPDVYNYWDRGLLGMALHPNFPATPYVYALYTRDALPGGSSPRWSDACPTPPGPNADGCVATGRLVRLTAAGNVASGAPMTLITDWCQQFPSHSMGHLEFGSDGMLYASAGEGASFTGVDYGQRGGTQAGTPTPANPCGDPPSPAGTANTSPTGEGGALRSQDLRTSADPAGLSGSILRIDPITGLAAAGNPLIASSDLNARRIVAYGLRNPFRFTFRPATSELWIGDVGFMAHEEIDRVTNVGAPVENFGWPCYEGSSRNSSYDNTNLDLCEALYAESGAVTGPWLTYAHSAPAHPTDTCPTGGASIAGLAFYEGGSFPAAYDGALFFADYSRSCIWAALPSAPGALPSPTNLQTFVTVASGVIELDIGPGGDLYYVDFGDPDGILPDGTIRRLHYAPGNQPPTALVTATPSFGPTPLQVAFDGSDSSDPDAGDLLSYAWDLDNDGSFDDGSGETASRTFSSAGDFTVRLRVTDAAGDTDIDSVIVHPGNSPPIPVIATPSSTTTWAVGQSIPFSGSADNGEGSPLPATALTWSLVMHHCPSACHQHQIQTFQDVASGSFVAPDHEYPSHLELVLAATDPQGLTATTSVDLDPRTVQLTFLSQPTGAELSASGVTDAAPFTLTTIVGSSVSVSAPDQQLGASQLDFDTWSDGGSQSHEITAPATNASYTATFDVTGPPGPPAFGSTPDREGYEGQTLSFTVSATDPDGGSVTYGAAGLPAGFSIDAATGVVRGIAGYSGSGSWLVTVTATDDEDASTQRALRLTIHDALFPARRATFSAGTHTGLTFAPDGTVASSKARTLARTSGASVDRRRLWNGRPYLHVIDGLWAGYWLPESAAIRLPGAVGEVRFSAARRADFVAGTHTGYLVSSSGSLGSPKTATLASDSGASVDRRMVVNGVPYLRIVNGIWAGRWVPEHRLAIAAGTHTAYEVEAGVVSPDFSYQLGGASGASSVARVAGPGGWYLAVSNGVFADHWLRESSAVRRRVALRDWP
jgi:glucose/arabinose dehydrogenase